MRNRRQHVVTARGAEHWARPYAERDQPMKFRTTRLADAVVIEMTPHHDERGEFARTFCRREFRDAGLEWEFVQANASVNHRKGTLRGMHYQVSPNDEVKVVRCVKGAIFDVIIDLRIGSRTFMAWQGFHLRDDNDLQLYVPQGFAHGFVSLVDESAITYMVSAAYAPNAERGVRWNDPAFRIEWPVEITTISEKDSSWPDFDVQDLTLSER